MRAAPEGRRAWASTSTACARSSRSAASLYRDESPRGVAAMLQGHPLHADARRHLEGSLLSRRDLPPERAARDRVLLAAMGSPDPRQIDGIGGAHPADQQGRRHRPLDPPRRRRRLSLPAGRRRQGRGQRRAELRQHTRRRRPLGDRERPRAGAAARRRRCASTWSTRRACAVAHVPTPGGAVEYEGDARIDGVPGTAAPIPIDFLDVAGSSCGALLPTGAVLRPRRRHRRDLHRQRHAGGLILRGVDFGKTGS